MKSLIIENFALSNIKLAIKLERNIVFWLNFRKKFNLRKKWPVWNDLAKTDLIEIIKKT